MEGRSGFTLLEILVALTLGGLGVSLAVAIFTTASDGVRAVDGSSVSWDREQNAQRWLSEAFASVDIGGEAGRFEGSAGRVRFRTRGWSASGWAVPTTVEIGVEAGALVAGGGAESLTLADSVGLVRFDFLGELGGDAPWLGSWGSETSAPLAVRLQVERLASQTVDTLLLWVGPRG